MAVFTRLNLTLRKENIDGVLFFKMAEVKKGGKIRGEEGRSDGWGVGGLITVTMSFS